MLSREPETFDVQNSTIPVGVFRKPEHTRMWRWAAGVLPSASNAALALSIILYGMFLPFEIRPPARLSRRANYINPTFHPRECAWVTKQLEALASDGSLVWLPPDQPSDHIFVHSIFVVPKKDSFRLIIDFRRLNEFLEHQGFSLPTLRKIRERLATVKGGWVIDFSAAFNHMEIAPQHQRYFGIEWNGRIGYFRVAPFGCSCVPYYFQVLSEISALIHAEIGLSPRLQTAQDWQRFAQEAHVPPRHMYSVTTDTFLDDKGSWVNATIRAKDGTLESEARTRELAPLLAKSAVALDEAFGWHLSKKSDYAAPYSPKQFLGFNLNFSTETGTSGSFEIPAAKVEKNVSRFRTFRSRFTVQRDDSVTGTATLKEIAKIAGQILQFWLIWEEVAHLLTMPFYFIIARIARADANFSWYTRVSLSVHELRLLDKVIQMLSPGKHFWISERMVQLKHRIVQRFEQFGQLTRETIFTDAGDLGWAGWISNLPPSEAFQATLRTILRCTDIVAAWSLLPLDYLFGKEKSSTLRELYAILAFYSPARVQALLQSTEPLCHCSDSQAAVNILRRGSSRSALCHELSLQIHWATAALKRQRGLTFVWISRWINLASDEMSKYFDSCIANRIVLALQQYFYFTLDAFAHATERISSPAGSIPFCSRSAHPESLGQANQVSWDSRVVWAFPPPRAPHMVWHALFRCQTQISGLVVLCLPAWPHAEWHHYVQSMSWKFKLTLPRGSTAHLKKRTEAGPSWVQDSFPVSLYFFYKDSATWEHLVRLTVQHVHSVTHTQ